MQSRYVGDVGDYVKYALLRRILKAEGGNSESLGICTPTKPMATVGIRNTCIARSWNLGNTWIPNFSGKLKALVDRKDRCISAIQQDSELLGGNARFSRKS